jgi:hypothetical protein
MWPQTVKFLRQHRDWIFAGVSLGAALVVLVLLITQDGSDEDSGPEITRTTPWKELNSLPGLGTLEYSCGYPGRLTATRFVVPESGQPERITVIFGRRSLTADVRPSEYLPIPYEPSGSHIWVIHTTADTPSRARIDVAFPAARTAAERTTCERPNFVLPVFEVAGGRGDTEEGAGG